MADHRPTPDKPMFLGHVDINPDDTFSCHKCAEIICAFAPDLTIGALATLAKVHICPKGEPDGPALPV